MSQSLVNNLIHLVYSTKHREPSIPQEFQADLYAYQVVSPFQGCLSPIFRTQGGGNARGARIALPWATMSRPLRGKSLTVSKPAPVAPAQSNSPSCNLRRAKRPPPETASC